KRMLVSVVTGALLTGSLMAAPGNDRARTKKTVVRESKPTATTTVRSNRGVNRTHYVSSAPTRTVTRSREMRGTRYVSTAPDRTVTTGTNGAPVRTRVVTRSGSYYPYYGGYSGYGYGYPYYSGYSYGPSISFGFGSPYYGGYYPYDNYGYGYGYNSYPY